MSPRERVPFWRQALACAALAGAAMAPARATAQPPCRPPRDLRVCQDTYGTKSRAFLAWTNGESTYSRVRVFVDGVLAGEAPGDARSGYVPNLSLGQHTFEVEGQCGGTPTTRAAVSYTILASTPHTRPIESIACSYDAARGRLTASWVLASTPSLFIDVYILRPGVNGLIYVTTIFGDATTIAITGAEATDRLRLQFFDASCYGSELIACEGEPACLPPLSVRVCQDLYGSRPRVFVRWLAAASSYTGFDIFLDGVAMAAASPDRTFVYLDPVAAGAHTFSVRGRCGQDLTDMVTATFTVLEASPHTDPVMDLGCRHDEAAGAITATWVPGAAPSDFIDLYLRRPGISLLDFAGTLRGDATSVQVGNAGPGDQLVLQFFSAECYGSPLITCAAGPVPGAFRRGDTDGSGIVDLSDAVSSLSYLFLGGPAPLCFDAADSNDDARYNIGDPVHTLTWLFATGPEPPAPGPLACGADPTLDEFAECLSGACP